MRVKMLRTIEPLGLGGVRFEKGAHVDVSPDQAEEWLHLDPPACKVDQVKDFDKKAPLDLRGEKAEAAAKAKKFDGNGINTTLAATQVASEE